MSAEIKGKYTTDSISLTNGQNYPCRIDSTGALIVTPSSVTGPVVDGVHNNVLPTVADTASAPLQLDASGRLITTDAATDNTNNVLAVVIKPLAVSTYTASPFSNFGANATLNVKATPGNVYLVVCTNANASTRYIQLHNTATTPGAGNVPLLSFPVPGSGGTTLIDLGAMGGVNFSTGIAFGFSTTQGTYTAGTAGEQNTTVLFK